MSFLNYWPKEKLKKYLINLFDLLFIADERNDNMTIDEHYKRYKDYCENEKDLYSILKNYPNNQILSKLVDSIYKQLLKEITSYNLVLCNSIAYKKEST